MNPQIIEFKCFFCDSDIKSTIWDSDKVETIKSIFCDHVSFGCDITQEDIWDLQESLDDRLMKM